MHLAFRPRGAARRLALGRSGGGRGGGTRPRWRRKRAFEFPIRIQLKVKDEKVIGFEPWEDFPLNQGMLCPKGMKRYLQGSHPDRLLTPLIRTPDRFREADWPEALDLVVEHIGRIQAQYGRDAFALLSGASLTNEKAYLIGKFARLALRTKNIDYNGRLCMVSAGAANRMAFGIDRGGQPWSDIPLAKCLILAGTTSGSVFPSSPTTSGGRATTAPGSSSSIRA